METIFTERHQLRNSKTELFGGELVEPFERPSRAEDITLSIRVLTDARNLSDCILGIERQACHSECQL